MSNSLRRKIERSKKKQKQKDIKEKMGLFDKIPDCCLVCEKAFDKKDKDMVFSWYVIVREEEQKVNLYCPKCWERAKQKIEDVKQALAEADSDN
jgi:hypothetical protein